MKQTVTMNLRVSEFASRVLGAIKNRYGLKNKSEALDLFAGEFGEEFAEREVNDEVIAEVIKECEKHEKKHGLKSMTVSEFDALCDAM